MKSRRVVVTLEYETEEAIAVLKDKGTWTLWGDVEPDQVQVNVIREKPKGKKARSKKRK